MKKIISTFFSSFIISFAFAQSYYVKSDGSLTVGNEIADEGPALNSQFCTLKFGDNTKQLTPNMVREYGLQDGKVYVSFKLDSVYSYSRYFFLERLSKGKVDLFYLENKGKIRYFLKHQNSSRLIEMPSSKDEYSALLMEELKDCQSAISKIPYIRVDRKSLKRFIDSYNVCKSSLITSYQIGLNASFLAYKISNKNIDKYIMPGIYGYGYSLGLFGEVPITKNNFSLHTELNIERIKYTHSFITNDLLYNVSETNININLPILLKYTLRVEKTSPFVQIGALYGRSVKDDSSWSSESTSSGASVIKTNFNSILPINRLGFLAGIGVTTKTFSFELRYSRLLNSSELKKDQLNLIFGVML